MSQGKYIRRQNVADASRSGAGVRGTTIVQGSGFRPDEINNSSSSAVAVRGHPPLERAVNGESKETARSGSGRFVVGFGIACSGRRSGAAET